MKKILVCIIAIFSLFSIPNISFASEGLVEQLLDINIGVEKYDLDLATIDTLYFRDYQTQKTYDTFKKINNLLKKEIISKYRTGNFDYYQTKGIVTNHKNFVYYVNEFFYYTSIKETRPYYKEVDDAIFKSYEKIRSNYRRVKVGVSK
ncbi:hypothetical protein A9Q91_04745 [Candidatus Gracilibacteria bacterium 28_42_T64]|nr:hypothetical protein A9Q91_04745 [Candidatus Gracilibacteria bacterium 28_42_T64]